MPERRLCPIISTKPPAARFVLQRHLMDTQKCPTCGLFIAVPADHTGRWITCDCGTEFAIDRSTTLPAAVTPRRRAESAPPPPPKRPRREKPQPEEPPPDNDPIPGMQERSLAPVGITFACLLVLGLSGFGLVRLLTGSTRPPEVANASAPVLGDQAVKAAAESATRPIAQEILPAKAPRQLDNPSRPPSTGPARLGDPEHGKPRPTQTPTLPQPGNDQSPQPRPYFRFAESVLIMAVFNDELLVSDGPRLCRLTSCKRVDLHSGYVVRIQADFEAIGEDPYTRSDGSRWSVAVYRPVGPVQIDAITGVLLPNEPMNSPEVVATLAAVSTLDVIDVLIEYAKSRLDRGDDWRGVLGLMAANQRCSWIIQNERGKTLTEAMAKSAVIQSLREKSGYGGDWVTADRRLRLRAIKQFLSDAQQARQRADLVEFQQNMQLAIAWGRELARRYPKTAEAVEGKKLLGLR